VLRADRYTYIYNGLGDSPDYTIATRDLLRRVRAAGAVHVNADLPERRTLGAGGRLSDHDPLFVRFAFDPGAVTLDWRRYYEGRWRQR
jgi:predicted extracellular nuclease